MNEDYRDVYMGYNCTSIFDYHSYKAGLSTDSVHTISSESLRRRGL